jgi:hypothetical protein
VSIWESAQAADQMSRLKEMIVDARAAGEAASVTFHPIVNHHLDCGGPGHLSVHRRRCGDTVSAGVAALVESPRRSPRGVMTSSPLPCQSPLVVSRV